MEYIFDQKINPYCWKCEKHFNHETKYIGYCSEKCFLNKHNPYKIGKCLGCGLDKMFLNYFSYCNINCWEKLYKELNK